MDKYLFLFWYDEEKEHWIPASPSLSEGCKASFAQCGTCLSLNLEDQVIQYLSGCLLLCHLHWCQFYVNTLVCVCRKQTPHFLLSPQKRTSSVKLQYKEAVVYASGYVCVLLSLLWAAMTFLWLSSRNLTNYYRNYCLKEVDLYFCSVLAMGYPHALLNVFPQLKCNY